MNADESERRVAEALRARATGAGRGGGPVVVRTLGAATRKALAVALLAGAVLGAALAVLSLLAPGLLPTLG